VKTAEVIIAASQRVVKMEQHQQMAAILTPNGLRLAKK